jgi:ATP-dependent Clp protease ATP-binding subunit ClpC
MIFEKNDYTPSAVRVLRRAVDIAYNFAYQYVGSEHLLAALCDVPETLVDSYLSDSGITYDKIAERIQAASSKNVFNKADMELTPRVQKLLTYAKELSKLNGISKIGTEYILCALLAEDNSVALQILDEMEIDMVGLYKQLTKDNEIQVPTKHTAKAVTPMSQRRRRTKTDKNSKTPTLDSVAQNMTAAARMGDYDPTIGRHQEIDRIIHIISRRTKNNPVLVGDPGVGKTAIVEGLAQRIAAGEVPQNLFDIRLMMLNMANVVAGTSLRGEFEDRMVAIVEEVRKDPKTILFIDELHTIIGAGGGMESVNDASNILKPALARGDFRLIGATTYKEYQKYIEKDEALERRLARVTIEEPKQNEAVEIIRGLKEKFEDFHGVIISDEALKKTVEASIRYMPSRRLPDKAIDLLDEACASVKLSEKNNLSKLVALEKERSKLKKALPEAIEAFDIKRAKAINKELETLESKIERTDKGSANKRTVLPEDVVLVLSELTGIPVQQMSKSESERMIHLEEELHKRVIGQEEAVISVARAIRRSRSGVSSGHRPMGSFIFLGPTGVGKTELAKTLADSVFGSESALIRVDMSEYMEKFSTSRLIGAPPGYVGYDEGGQLTERVRNRPYAVVLLDEIEKAHPDVFNVLLQILDDGFVTDTKGRKVDFRNTIIIMASNLGATALRDDKTVGFGAKDWSRDYEAMKKRILEELKQHYRPEFLNRIDETLVFHHLDEEELARIVKLMTKQLIERMAGQNITLKINPAATRFLAKAGFDVEYGARPLRKAIERELENPLSEKILSKSVGKGDTVTVGVSGSSLRFS